MTQRYRALRAWALRAAEPRAARLRRDCADAGPADCCRPAVVRAFREMRSKGQPDRYCMEAALTVYRWHHPETPEPQANGIVTSWVTDGHVH